MELTISNMVHYVILRSAILRNENKKVDVKNYVGKMAAIMTALC